MDVQERKPEKDKETSAYFIKKYGMVLIGVVVAAILVGAIIIGVMTGRGAQQASLDPGQETTEGRTAAQESTQTAETMQALLEEDAYPQINALMQEYFQAATVGDTDKIRSLVESIDEEKLIYQEKRSAYIDSYQNLKCYTKKGPEDGSYAVYVSYDAKFKDMDALVPGVSPFLVYAREDGSYYIYEGELDDAVNQYLEEISEQDDVVDLMNRIQVRFNEIVMADEHLNHFLAEMRDNLKVEVGEALAEAEASQTAEEEPPEVVQEVVTAKEVRATDVVNVRASDSEQAEKIGKVQIGEVLPLLESKANGWTRVQYEGKEAYIKSDFLEFVEEEVAQGEGGAENGGGQDASPSGNSSPSAGTIKVGDTINIRKSASETAEKLAVCYQGDELEIVMKQADGWTRVRYKGQNGYVKSDVLTILE